MVDSSKVDAFCVRKLLKRIGLLRYFYHEVITQTMIRYTFAPFYPLLRLARYHHNYDIFTLELCKTTIFQFFVLILIRQKTTQIVCVIVLE